MNENEIDYQVECNISSWYLIILHKSVNSIKFNHEVNSINFPDEAGLS